MMSKSILYPVILFFLVSILNSGCLKGVDELYTMQISCERQIPAGLNPLLNHVFPIQNVPTRYVSFRDGNNYEEDQIGEIVAGNAILTTQFGDVDLNFIQSVEVHLVDSLDPNKRSEAFYLEFENLGSKTEIRLIPSLPNLASFIKSGNMDVEIQLDLRGGFSPISMNMRLDMEFLVLGVEE